MRYTKAKKTGKNIKERREERREEKRPYPSLLPHWLHEEEEYQEREERF
jgi:hypothetical protein